MINFVVRAMRLVEILKERGRPTALKEVAEEAGLSEVTAHRLLRSLCQSGIVQVIGENGQYALGPAVLTFAEGFRKSFTMRDRVLPYLEKLATLTKETALYCEGYGHAACVTIATWDSPHDTRTFSGTGIVRPLTTGSSALAILSMLPEKDIATHHRLPQMGSAHVFRPEYKKATPRENQRNTKTRICS